MSHLLHIDSSVRGDDSVSRRLTARAADRWRAAHPAATVTYRDLGTNPIPHLDSTTGLARMVAAEQRTAAQDASLALSAELIDEIKRADTVLLGLPLYNFGPPSTVKAWVDHIIATGLSIDAETHTGLLGDTHFIVLASRGGGPGTPREGWDHAQTWLPHALSATGLQPRFITAELTTADANPKMAHLKPLAAESLNKALGASTSSGRPTKTPPSAVCCRSAPVAPRHCRPAVRARLAVSGGTPLRWPCALGSPQSTTPKNARCAIISVSSVGPTWPRARARSNARRNAPSPRSFAASTSPLSSSDVDPTARWTACPSGKAAVSPIMSIRASRSPPSEPVSGSWSKR